LEACKKKLIIARTKLKRRAHQNPLTANPETIFAVRRIRPALITKVKSPRVIIFIGRVRMTKMGFIIALIIPRTIATAIAVVKLATETPGKI